MSLSPIHCFPWEDSLAHHLGLLAMVLIGGPKGRYKCGIILMEEVVAGINVGVVV